MAQEENLEPIAERKTIERYLQYALDFHEYVSCSCGSIRFEARPQSFDPTALMLRLEITEESFEHLRRGDLRIIDTPPQNIRISFLVHDVLFFAHTLVEERRTRSLVLAVDTPIFKLQRRNAVRIKLMNEHKAGITLAGKNFVPHDLSATGLSLVLNLDLAERFMVGQTFMGSRLRFLQLDALVDLEVVGNNPVKEGFWKVGFRFRGLNPTVEQWIAKEAYLHTHKIWSRWL